MMFDRHFLRGIPEQPAWLKVARLFTAAICFLGVGASLPARGQPAADGFDTWKDVEFSPQFKAVVDALKGGGVFNDTARDFVAGVILPQFGKAENLPTIDDVRKKIRDRLLQPIKNDAAFSQASTFIRDRLTEIARDPKADLLQRVNAMIFIGEMTDNDKEKKLPWSPALESLAATARDPAIDPAVRIAAVVGMNNHLASIRRMTADQAAAVRAAVAAALPSLLPPPATAPKDTLTPRSPATSWLARRGISMIPAVMNPVSPDMASQLVAVIDDASWPIDVRVRAAAALGETVGAESGVDTPAVIESIGKLAIAALETDIREGKRLAELQSFKAGAEAGGRPRGPIDGTVPGMIGASGPPMAAEGLSVTMCQRAAWRLSTLGDAILSEGRTGGLAATLDQNADDAKRLAVLLKDIGEQLDAEPSGSVLLRGLDELDPAGAKKRAGRAAPADAPQQPVDSSPAAPEAEKPDPKPTDSPFGDSPF